MSAHAERVYPEECCGLMLGQIARSAEDAFLVREVLELLPLENRWRAECPCESAAASQRLTRARRYAIDPKDMLRSQKQAREKGLNIIGIYHSHPDHTAEPSECDRAQAWPDYIYTIVSVMKGRAVDTLHWTLDSNHQFQLANIQAPSGYVTGCYPA